MSYTHGHADAVLKAHRWRNAANSAGYLLDHMEPGRSLLDVGCGPGTLTVDLARLLAPGRVVGVDAESAVLDEARQLAAQARMTNVEFHKADAYSLPYDDGSFDIVHAHQLLQHLEHPSSALTEMARVCRTGGIVAARDGDYSAFTWFPADPLLDRWLEVYEAVARANGGEPDAGRRLRAWARASGLSEVTSSASVWCYSTEEDRTWWAETWAERTSSTLLADRAVELGIATREELLEIAAAWHAWASQQDGWFAVLHGEICCRV
ncbi:MAG: methyltransferase domain-containing protein [Acidimicrobiales bacterium]